MAARLPRSLTLVGIAIFIAGCTGLNNYLSGSNWDGTPIHTVVELTITNNLEEDILAIWGRDEVDDVWRLLAGLPAGTFALTDAVAVPSGGSSEVKVIEGRNELKLATVGGRKIIQSVYAHSNGTRLQIGQPVSKRRPVVATPTPRPTPEPAPVHFTAVSASEAPESTPPEKVDAQVSDIVGTWQTRKLTNSHYGNVDWKSLTVHGNGRATWRWHRDFTNSSLRRSGDSCHTETEEFQMSYTLKSDGTLDLACRDRKERRCDGRVKQRGCFTYEIAVEITAEGLYVKNRDGDGVYTRQ